jgi:FixJ family two-component response regulator
MGLCRTTPTIVRLDSVGLTRRVLEANSSPPDSAHPGGATLPKVPVIAIVDDDESFRRATASFIRSLGYSVFQFASAQTFLKSDYLDNTDCVISDVQMPGMNGIELQNELIAQGRRLPVIFVTAFPEMNARSRALAAGAIGFLAKPFSDVELIACVNTALAASGGLK